MSHPDSTEDQDERVARELPEIEGNEDVNDFMLLKSWRGGDRDAGDLLLTRYFDVVCRFIRNRADPRDVDDLVQATFLDCVENRGQIRTEGSFRGFILAVARYRFYDHLRARKPDRDAETMSNMSLVDLGTTPSRRVARDQESQLLWAALDTIPAEQQMALELAYWEGFTGPEIAVVLGVEAGTVRSRLTRARGALRERLVADLGDAPAANLLRRLSENPERSQR